MNGRDVGRAELEYALPGVIDSIAFGAAGTPLAGLMLASSQLGSARWSLPARQRLTGAPYG
jgi:hypothetical protein